MGWHETLVELAGSEQDADEYDIEHREDGAVIARRMNYEIDRGRFIDIERVLVPARAATEPWTYDGYWNVVLGASRNAEDVIREFELGPKGLDEWLGHAETDAWAMGIGRDQGDDLPEEWGAFHERALSALRAECAPVSLPGDQTNEIELLRAHRDIEDISALDLRTEAETAGTLGHALLIDGQRGDLLVVGDRVGLAWGNDADWGDVRADETPRETAARILREGHRD